VLLALLSALSLAVLVPTGAIADDESDERDSEGRLVVERVLVKGANEDGVEIEVHYRLIDVEQLPGHPSKTTLIMDEESQQGVMLGKLQALASPVSEDEAEETPAATLIFRDDRGVIRPGRPVSVAVAGLVHKHVVPEAGPGYSEDALERTRARSEVELLETYPPDATLEIYEAKLTGAGSLLQVRFKTEGIMELSADAKHTYVLDPETGERFHILRVPRIGLMAPKRLGEYEAGSYMVVRNPDGKIKQGQRITVVVEGLRRDVVVE
jgi:hypothetical protein